MRIRPTQMMSIAQQDRILQAIKRMFPSEYPVFALMHETGLRPAEALALTTEDFTPDPAAIIMHPSITKLGLKSRHSRALLLSTDLGNLIYELANSSVSETRDAREAPFLPRVLLVNPKTGKRWTTQHLLKNVWQPVLHELGIEQAHMMDLRHNAVKRMVSNGVPMDDIARILGHHVPMQHFMIKGPR